MKTGKVDKKQLFGDLDFNSLSTNPDFKEDSVREVILLPILEALGYGPKDIVRSKTLKHPFLKVGSSNKIRIELIPDYCLKVENSFACVLDAKSPNEAILDEGHIAQVYSYATHPEIQSTYFALCNGLEFALFRREGYDRPVLQFSVDEIGYSWETLLTLLSPESFHIGKNITYDTTNATVKPAQFDYTTRPLLDEIPVKKQQASRHFGVHGYFTKQSWNVVAEYIKNYSQPGDLVLDPFGGSGVTAIEAMWNNRKAISIDINPMAVLIVRSLIAPVKEGDLQAAFARVKRQYMDNDPKTPEQMDEILARCPYPLGVKLPKGSDVQYVEELFSKRQLAQLALLKSVIMSEPDNNARKSLMLMFSGLLNKINLTYHASAGRTVGRGNSSVFAYYRYRIAKEPGAVDLLPYLESRFLKVSRAKKELAYHITEGNLDDCTVVKGTATDLGWIPNESVDYIYTDPPYGKKIPYLDLSVMWNAWLDLDVTNQDRAFEAIEGGENHKSKQEYNQLIAQSIKEMYRVLKFDRWLSFVFAHKDPAFWHLIVETAESCGFEYIGAVPQKNGQTSFKKRQHPFTVLSGQLIINFRKVRNPRAILRANLGMDMEQVIMQTIEGIIAKNDGATLEQINDELIIRGLEMGFLDLLKKEYKDLTPLLANSFDFDEKTKRFTIPPDTKFRTNVDVRLRIRFYLLSYLRRMERENRDCHFDDIIGHIMPLLKNGITPERQTILNVLQDVGETVGYDSWREKKDRLFD